MYTIWYKAKNNSIWFRIPAGTGLFLSKTHCHRKIQKAFQKYVKAYPVWEFEIRKEI